MPKYEPNKWNKDLNLRESHNCYSYFLNKISKKSVNECKKKLKSKNYEKKSMKITKILPCSPCKRPHPGVFSKENLYNKNLNCKDITRKVLNDNKLVKLKQKNSKKCPKKHYEGILIVYPNKDYHFVRVDNDGNMSHKDGVQKVSRYLKILDSKNNKVKKYKLNRKNLKIYEKLGGKICQSFCVPDLPNKLNYKTNFYKNNDCPISKNKDQIDKKNIKDKRLYYYFKYLENPKKYKNNKYIKNYIS